MQQENDASIKSKKFGKLYQNELTILNQVGELSIDFKKILLECFLMHFAAVCLTMSWTIDGQECNNYVDNVCQHLRKMFLHRFGHPDEMSGCTFSELYNFLTRHRFDDDLPKWMNLIDSFGWRSEPTSKKMGVLPSASNLFIINVRVFLLREKRLDFVEFDLDQIHPTLSQFVKQSLPI